MRRTCQPSMSPATRALQSPARSAATWGSRSLGGPAERCGGDLSGGQAASEPAMPRRTDQPSAMAGSCGRPCEGDRTALGDGLLGLAPSLSTSDSSGGSSAGPALPAPNPQGAHWTACRPAAVAHPAPARGRQPPPRSRPPQLRQWSSQRNGGESAVAACAAVRIATAPCGLHRMGPFPGCGSASHGRLRGCDGCPPRRVV